MKTNRFRRLLLSASLSVTATAGWASAQAPALPVVPPGSFPAVGSPRIGMVPVAQPTTPGGAGAQPAIPGGPAAVPGEPPGNQPLVTPQESTPQPTSAPTFHDHKYPVLPLAPPGAFPVSPAGPGFYTLLDQVRGTPTEAPPRFPYSRISPIALPFFDTSFTYLDSIPFEDRDWAEKLKRIPVGDHWLFSTGGEIRERYDYLKNAYLSGKQDSNAATRLRTYGDLWYEDVFRFYAEGIVTNVSGTKDPPQSRDIDTVDFLNLFVDLKLLDLGGNPIYGRVGRQQLVYGSQRLVASNDFGNNLPRYDAAKLFYRSSNWDVDLFAARPIIIEKDNLGTEDHNRFFSGAWATYKPKAGTFFDFYYLNLYNQTPGVTGTRPGTKSLDVNTLGSRTTGRADNGFLWDFEGAGQFGRFANQAIGAAMADAYVGWNFRDVAFNPTFWIGYDYASGGSNTGGTHGTFNQLFNFAHYYFGMMDIIGRQNIQDFNVQAYLYPTKWWLTGLQYHVLQLANNRDSLYNSSGVVERSDPTGRSGGQVGSILSPITNFHLTNRQDIFIQYSHFFQGSYIDNTKGSHMPSDNLYVQYSWRW